MGIWQPSMAPTHYNSTASPYYTGQQVWKCQCTLPYEICYFVLKEPFLQSQQIQLLLFAKLCDGD